MRPFINFSPAVILFSVLSPASAIFQGTHSNCGEQPSAVQITTRTAAGGLCGGTLITEKHVLTAGHCVLSDHGFPVDPAPASTVEINLLKCNSDRKLAREGGEKFGVVAVHTQDRYFTQGIIDSDIVVLELDRPVKYHPFLADPANVPAYEGPVDQSWEDNTRLTLRGAGTYSLDITKVTEWLRQVRAEVITKQECATRVDAINGVPNSMSYFDKAKYFCAVDRITLGAACGGDSGSGSVEYLNGKKRVVGVVTSGNVICSNPNHVNMYVSVGAYLGWIKSKVGTGYSLKQV